MRHDSVTPYGSGDEKNRQVARMFDSIAKRYDFLNGFLSFGTHRRWRRAAINAIGTPSPKHILDVATGTGDLAIEALRLKPDHITGIDISEGMLALGREKVARLRAQDIITLQYGNAETIEFADASFDAITAGFGVRNFQDLAKGLQNLRRILKPGGKLVILEFSYPTNPFFRAMYRAYSRWFTPAAGRVFSSDRKAYAYLTESVKAFPHNEAFTEVLSAAGFRDCQYKTLTFGIVAVYTAMK